MKKERKGRISEKKNRCYSGPPYTCGFGIRYSGKKSDAVGSFFVYFCAVLRFSSPPYAPLPVVKIQF